MVRIDLWSCNVVAFQVFKLCRVDCVGLGMEGRLYWTGIPPQQIESACRLRRVPPAERHGVAEDVSYMGDRVSDERNRRQAAART